MKDNQELKEGREYRYRVCGMVVERKIQNTINFGRIANQRWVVPINAPELDTNGTRDREDDAQKKVITDFPCAVRIVTCSNYEIFQISQRRESVIQDLEIQAMNGQEFMLFQW